MRSQTVNHGEHGRLAYRIELEPSVFLLCGLLLVSVVWLTVAGVAFRAARANPIEALRQE